MQTEAHAKSAATPGHQEPTRSPLPVGTDAPLGGAFAQLMILLVIVAYYTAVWLLKVLSRAR